MHFTPPLPSHTHPLIPEPSPTHLMHASLPVIHSPALTLEYSLPLTPYHGSFTHSALFPLFLTPLPPLTHSFQISADMFPWVVGLVLELCKLCNYCDEEMFLETLDQRLVYIFAQDLALSMFVFRELNRVWK